MNNCGIYVHIPFCESKCSYCDFFSRVTTKNVKENYLTDLINQIRSVRYEDFLVKTIYIGGGTPSVLGGKAIRKIAEEIYSVFNVDENIEFTVEVNPESVSAEFISEIISAGVNRISMGIQSFNDEELKILGRRASSQKCKDAFTIIRDGGIENISIDLMLAVPGQTDKTLEYSLKQAVSLSPEHISAYLLKIEKDTVFEKKGITEASDDIQQKMYLFTSNYLISNGYEHYEISNYAKPGFKSKHNLSYWKMIPYIAFGAGAYGFDGKTRYYYNKNIDDFMCKNIEEVLDEKTIEEERVMLGLRTSDGVLLPTDKISYADNLIKNGYMKKVNNKYALTPKGFLVSNKIISDIL
ncbi:MAG: hypothetical protein DBX47_04400 [Clostridiales bacterium]|nr:MAG: hypothetical protein DBX47_04400 [Clostridiales bacterium]